MTTDHPSRYAVILDALALARTPTPSVSLIERTWRAIEAAEASEPFRDRVARLVQSFSGKLVADSLEPSTAVRGATGAVDRMLLYQAGPYTVSVSASVERDEMLTVRGQVIPGDGGAPIEPGTVVLSTRNKRQEAALSEWGAFTMADVSAGSWDITICMGTTVLELNVTLPQEEP